jgi:hypothetical protein
MWMELLAFYEQASTVVKGYWEEVKKQTRSWLGPEPQNWYLLPDGRVFPSFVMLPDDVRSESYVFDPHTNRITKVSEEPEGRFRPLPYLSLVVGDVDLSDWLGEIRANPIPASMPVQQMITLWSLLHNRYLPVTNVTVRYTTSDGTETVLNIE